MFLSEASLSQRCSNLTIFPKVGQIIIYPSVLQSNCSKLPCIFCPGKRTDMKVTWLGCHVHLLYLTPWLRLISVLSKGKKKVGGCTISLFYSRISSAESASSSALTCSVTCIPLGKQQHSYDQSSDAAHPKAFKWCWKLVSGW